MLDESECLAICLERYMPTALCVLAGSYLPHWPRFRPAPDNEWIPSKSQCRGAMIRSTADRICFYVGTPDPQTPDGKGTEIVSVRHGSRIFKDSSSAYWRASDGHWIWGFKCPARDIVVAKVEEQNERGLVLKQSTAIMPSIGNILPNAYYRDLSYDYVTKELLLVYREHELGGTRMCYEWCCPATLKAIRDKSFVVKDGSPLVQTTICACAGWVFQAATSERVRENSGGAVLSALAPNGVEFQELRTVNEVRNSGNLLPIDDETVLWLLPCNGGSYTSADGRVLSVTPAVTSEDVLAVCADFVRPVVADFHFRALRLHIQPAISGGVCVEDHGVLRLPVIQSPNVPGRSTLLWNTFMPIICAERRQPVGVAADLVVDIMSHTCCLVPLL
jgi:hypothetical protein